jgi:hypothetical protein
MPPTAQYPVPRGGRLGLPVLTAGSVWGRPARAVSTGPDPSRARRTEPWPAPDRRLRLGAGRVLDVAESFSIEQRVARLDAGAAYLLTDGAVTMMRRVPTAFVGTARARAHARLQQSVNDEIIPMGSSRQDPRGGGAHIRACQAKLDARGHFGDVVLGEIGVIARRARLDTFRQASIAAATSTTPAGTAVGEAANISLVSVKLPPSLPIAAPRLTPWSVPTVQREGRITPCGACQQYGTSPGAIPRGTAPSWCTLTRIRSERLPEHHRGTRRRV